MTVETVDNQSERRAGLTERQQRQFSLARWCYAQLDGILRSEDKVNAVLSFVFKEDEQIDPVVKDLMLSLHNNSARPVASFDSINKRATSKAQRQTKAILKHIESRICPNA